MKRITKARNSRDGDDDIHPCGGSFAGDNDAGPLRIPPSRTAYSPRFSLIVAVLPSRNR